MDITKCTFPSIVGQGRTKEELRSALLADRNVVIVGPPGVGKTTLARDVATASPSGVFVRVQGSPDLTAEDLIGDIDPIKAIEFGPSSKEAFTPGKIFKADGGVLFFDEVNRCSEKLQNALLQALEERRVTIAGYDLELEADFIFIGTMNPEDNSTEELSDVFLDRFDMIRMGYPETHDIEDEIVRKNLDDEGATMPDGLQRLVIAFVRQLREDANLEKKPSVRATMGVVERARTTAVLRGRNEVVPDDIVDVLPSVIAHRISLKASVRYLEKPEEYVRERFEAFGREHGLEGGVP